MPKINPKSVRLVDGFRIRHTLDPDFASFHCHSTAITKYYMPKYYIPKGEWWLDVRLKEELDFFLRLESIDRPQTAKSGSAFRLYLRKRLFKKDAVPDYVQKKEWGWGYRLVIVDGAVIRQYVDPEFTQGGHDLVYSYIPKGEIWIEQAVDSEERPFILQHELVERKLMSRGKIYDSAHEYATAAEKDLRRQHGGFYPVDNHYPWVRLSDEEIRNKYYVDRTKKSGK